MTYLLDTSTFLWAALGERKFLSSKAIHVLEESQASLALSSISILEIVIKYSLGKLAIPSNPKTWLPDAVLKMGLQQLSVTHRHSLDVIQLPHHHKDPFDRLLIAQARVENMSLLTPDAMIKKYRVKAVW